jgi:glycosyltransferase involved in cell wall biosynthesis
MQTDPCTAAVGDLSPDVLRVTLVVPVYNEESTIARLIASIQAQTRPADEVVLVDAGSTDRTAQIARECIGTDEHYRILHIGKASPGRGRNFGIAAARTDWVALTDAGIVLEPAWLEQLVLAAQADPSARVVYGNYEPQIRSFFESCAFLAYVAPKHFRDGTAMRGPSVVSTLLHRSAWQAVGGFPDMRAAEDLIFMRRLDERGFKAAWAPAATAWWELRPGLVSTFRKFVLYSRANVWAGQQRYWHYGLARLYVVALVLAALGMLHHPGWFALLGLAAVARTARSIWRRREGRSWWWLFNPLRFAGVALVLQTIDIASFIGWARAKRESPPPGADATGSELRGLTPPARELVPPAR